MSSKRSTAAVSSQTFNKKVKVTVNDNKEDQPMGEWRAVLTGEFVLKPKVVLESKLKEKGTAVTGSISGKTTHLIVGKSGTNEYGKTTGVGSSKYKQAQEKNLTILTEKQVWAILSGTITASDISNQKQAAKVKATKSSPLSDKVLFCIQEIGESKISLAKLKKELESRFEMKFDNTRSKNLLKKALDTLLEEGKIEKDGASYKLADDDATDPAATAAVEWTQQDNEIVLEDRIAKLCPEVGRWRGLHVMSTKKATGKAVCKACGQKIEKGGEQVQVLDDSLFRMVVWPEDHHEGVSRGYVECSYPGHEVISRNKFFIHTQCSEAANEQFGAQFQRDWTEVRPHEIAARRS